LTRTTVHAAPALTFKDHAGRFEPTTEQRKPSFTARASPRAFGLIG